MQSGFLTGKKLQIQITLLGKTIRITKKINVSSIKDLRVIFDSRLNFRQHIGLQDKINKAGPSMIGLIKRNFIHMDKHTFVMLYKSLVRTHIEYAVSVYGARIKRETEDIKKIQKRATKLIISFKKIIVQRSTY